MVLTWGLIKNSWDLPQNSSVLCCRKGKADICQTDYTVLSGGVHLSLRCMFMHSEVRGMAVLERMRMR